MEGTSTRPIDLSLSDLEISSTTSKTCSSCDKPLKKSDAAVGCKRPEMQNVNCSSAKISFWNAMDQIGPFLMSIGIDIPESGSVCWYVQQRLANNRIISNYFQYYP